VTPVLFLHGFLGAPSTFDAVAADLSGIATIRPWLPGHHPTARAPLPETFEQVVDGIAASLPEPVVVCGYSMGARLGLSLAIRHPHLVEGAVLIGVSPGLAGEERAEREQWDDSQASEIVVTGMQAFVERWEKQPLFASQTRLPNPVRIGERVRRMTHDARGAAWAMRTLGLSRQPDYSAQLASIGSPLTLLSGAEDEKFTAIHSRMAEASPAIVARVVDGCGHNLALEAPRVVALAVREQLDALVPVKGRSVHEEERCCKSRPLPAPQSSCASRPLEPRARLRGHPLREVGGWHREDHDQSPRSA